LALPRFGGLGFYGANTNQKLIGADNPAAGIYAMQALVSLGFEVLAASCGISVIWRIFSRKEKTETPTGR
jgi:hypothetical protein